MPWVHSSVLKWAGAWVQSLAVTCVLTSVLMCAVAWVHS